MNANGGDPITMSSLRAFRTWRGHVSHMASTSRCVVTGALGLPVVPDVKASSAISSAAVGQASKVPLLPAASEDSESAASGRLNATSLLSNGCARFASRSSSSSLPSHSATDGCDLSMISPSSLARSKGIVATAISPALTTASHASAMPIELPPRSSTPIARHQRQVVDQHLRDAIDLAFGLGIGQRPRGRAQHRPVGKTLGTGLIEKHLDQIGLVRHPQLWQVVAKSRQQLVGGQAVVDETVDLCAHHQGLLNTAFPMISCWTSVAPS